MDAAHVPETVTLRFLHLSEVGERARKRAKAAAAKVVLEAWAVTQPERFAAAHFGSFARRCVAFPLGTVLRGLSAT
jgi:hypothetical protein